MISSGMIIAKAMPPKMHLASSSLRNFFRTSRVSANRGASDQAVWDIGGMAEEDASMLFLSNSTDNQIGGKIHHEGDAEEQHADEEQDAVMVGALGGLTEFGRDGRG